MITTFAKLLVFSLVVLACFYAAFRALKYVARRVLRIYRSGWTDDSRFDREALVWRRTADYAALHKIGVVVAGLMILVFLFFGFGRWTMGAESNFLPFIFNAFVVAGVAVGYEWYHPEEVIIDDNQLVTRYRWRVSVHDLEQLKKMEIFAVRHRYGIFCRFADERLWIPANISGVAAIEALLRDLLNQDHTADA